MNEISLNQYKRTWNKKSILLSFNFWDQNYNLNLVT